MEKKQKDAAKPAKVLYFSRQVDPWVPNLLHPSLLRLFDHLVSFPSLCLLLLPYYTSFSGFLICRKEAPSRTAPPLLSVKIILKNRGGTSGEQRRQFLKVNVLLLVPLQKLGHDPFHLRLAHRVLQGKERQRTIGIGQVSQIPCSIVSNGHFPLDRKSVV